ncbi:nitric oxide reductase activation protein NorD [Hydrogenophaga sp.]|uniref:nitric oxide reductase activation protein NorD n=1 Tax=Hydrogenophaga sp. TaxID=1904254 RepID=UPI0035621CCB
MEEWVGGWWHRIVTRAAQAEASEAAVALDDMHRSIGLLFRAGGGATAVRITASADARHGGPRHWLQRLAGTALRTPQPQLHHDTLALPPTLSVFADSAANRDLYLWLAAMASVFVPSGNWIADNRRATVLALQQFAGLRARFDRLSRQHLAQRPALEGLKPGDARYEAAVQAALRGEAHAELAVRPEHVAPVWLWLEGFDAPVPGGGAPGAAGDAAPRPDAAPDPASAKRRRSRRVQDDPSRHPMLLAAKTDALMSWSELVRLDRGSDDEANPDACAAADDMDTLSLARSEQTTASRVKFDLDLPSASADELPLGPGHTLPEWDWRQQRLLPEHCQLQTLVARPGTPYIPPPALRAMARRVQKRLEVLHAAPQRQRAQCQGDEIDLDAWVRFSSERRSGSRHSDSPAVYSHTRRAERSLATLLLADLSLSTDAYATNDARVIDVIREALYVFGQAMAATGDAFEMLGFSSVRRNKVRIQHLKGFEERWNEVVRARVGALKPGFYTRMGAAVREATRRLDQRPERQRLLLVLTDGKPNDLDIYEGRYGLEDTRHAVQEARQAGLVPFCVTIDEKAHDYLPHLFGGQGYALVRRPQDLVHRLTQAWIALAR